MTAKEATIWSEILIVDARIGDIIIYDGMAVRVEKAEEIDCQQCAFGLNGKVHQCMLDIADKCKACSLFNNMEGTTLCFKKLSPTRVSFVRADVVKEFSGNEILHRYDH